MTQHFLEGKTINTIQIGSRDQRAVLFKCVDGDHIAIADTDGGPCAPVWIESIEAPALGFPCAVLSVTDLDLSTNNEETDRGDVIDHYGCKISTDKGDIVIEYRNENNGFYGGWLEWPDGRNYENIMEEQCIYNENWQEVEFV